MKNSKLQIPNFKKAPNLNIQIFKKISLPRQLYCLEFRNWSLEIIWHLKFGIWNFPTGA
jgi:hypothetical protein